MLIEFLDRISETVAISYRSTFIQTSLILQWHLSTFMDGEWGVSHACLERLYIDGYRDWLPGKRLVTSLISNCSQFQVDICEIIYRNGSPTKSTNHIHNSTESGEHSNRMRTTRLPTVSTHPPLKIPSVEIPNPGKDMGPEIAIPSMNRFTDTCENITFPQLLLRAVIKWVYYSSGKINKLKQQVFLSFQTDGQN